MKYTRDMICGILTVASLIIIISCATTIELIDQETAQQIPNGAKRVLLISSTLADSLYQRLYTVAVREGFGIKSSNNEMRSFTTEPKDVGGDTYLRMNVIVEISDGLSVATINGQWQFGVSTQAMQRALVGYSTTPTWEDAFWAGSGTKHRMAFAAMVKFAKEFPNTSIEYE